MNKGRKEKKMTEWNLLMGMRNTKEFGVPSVRNLSVCPIFLNVANYRTFTEATQVAQQYRADTARYRPMLMSIDEHR